jgi:type I restriction enzyme M protein
MLDTVTKRRIDTARDILVGKVPDPKSQVEQITIALIYKFMDDMDAESEEFGGKRKFFAKEFARYGWAKLIRSGLGGHETLNLYAEAIAKMPENPGIPPLFRDIFKNAYLPYRDPETLRAFLKIIDEFNYDHSERLGDAFEYLLSVLGSQGDAGQFRTPRHIIDFMVAVIDPKKTETVLDPACGTAGFLISAYKHILHANKSKTSTPSTLLQNTLTPDERGRLAANFKGYDISPDMVRLSLVNLYLHGFADPHIVEYDTLTSEERWNEFADVILANPPFMSPKGGIKPHKRFSIQAKRSEVLFVDYMAEHLTPNGRAAIIVPEGIIFQSQTAYKALRKLLVENSLVAVVSLPAGCFNPYSGVKTSILILDKSLAKAADTIAFFKVENDGFGLGAQRRAFDKNDLPQVQSELAAYLQALRAKTSTESILSSTSTAQIVPKEKIAANGDYNLSGERYRESGERSTKFPWTELGAITLGKPQYGSGARKVSYNEAVRYIRITDLTERGELKEADPVSPSTIEEGCFLKYGDLLIARSGSVGRAYLHEKTSGNFQFAGYLIRFRLDPAKAIPAFVFQITQSPHWNEWIVQRSKTGTISNINAQEYSSFRLPLPPLAVQKEIVAEIEGYQKVINGARAVLDHYRPHIPIHPDWPMVELGDLADVKLGKMLDQVKHQKGEVLPYARNVSVRWGTIDTHDLPEMYFEEDELERFGLRAGDVLVCEGGEPGRAAVWDGRIPSLKYQKALHRVRFRVPFEPSILVYLLQEMALSGSLIGWLSGTTIKHLTLESFKKLPIPLPPLATQQAIVAEIEAEQALVAANRELIARFEKKIQATLARVWGGDEPVDDCAREAEKTCEVSS